MRSHFAGEHGRFATIYAVALCNGVVDDFDDFDTFGSDNCAVDALQEQLHVTVTDG
jgi:hypothetical protein